MTKVAKDYIRFREVAIDDIPDKGSSSNKNKSKWETFLEEFIASEFKAIEVEQGDYKTIHHTAAALRLYLRKTNWLDMFEVTVRDGHLYVINKNLAKTAKRKAIAANPPKKRGRPARKKKSKDALGCNGDGLTSVYKGSESTEVDYV